jgi:hypothetical protein
MIAYRTESAEQERKGALAYKVLIENKLLLSHASSIKNLYVAPWFGMMRSYYPTHKVKQE